MPHPTLSMEYSPREIETKWQRHWAEQATYRVSNQSDRPKYYVLDMFPYPSGAGLHVGHPLGYIASDIFSRYKRHKGFNVLHPMGYDAFGLPAEQYAIQTGVHPALSTEENIGRYRRQLDNLGFSFDWSREVKTCDPSYYRWTQKIFLLLFGHWYDLSAQKARPIAELEAHFAAHGNAGLEAATTYEGELTAEEWKGASRSRRDEILMNYRLAYRKMGHVNWCEALGTVLANDEVKDGVSERGGHPVVQRPMMQWTLRITAYAERLLAGLELVDFSDALKVQQRHWIGKSEGARLFFPVEGKDVSIEVFTTRPDTIFGATFMVLAPEHPLVDTLTTTEQRPAVDEYLRYVSSRTERERQADAKKVTGVFTGAMATNPITGSPVPVYIGEYVLVGYGTGAIMAVPAHDERDHRFAEHFSLPIVTVIDQRAHEGAGIEDKVGTLIHSGPLDGLSVAEAAQKVIALAEEKGIGKRQVNYRLRDANFSRQRYWGEPFPIEYDAEGVALPVEELPLLLPDLDNYKPTAEGKAPLARLTEWVNTPRGTTRETDTMPGYAGSSWYFLRYMDPRNEGEMFSQEAVSYWRDVDLYVGGSEHAVGHLLYSRFWHKFLHDLGLVPTEEPYKKLLNQGMIQGVAESIYMVKGQSAEKAHFISADLAAQYPAEALAKIPVHIQFVKEYGAPDSYLDAEGIEQFRQWRPEFAQAVFETNEAGRLVTHSEVGKMSKSLYNVVNPDDVVEQYGADCFRLYEMFLGPLEMSKPWDMRNIRGTYRFLQGFWGLFFDRDGTWRITDGEPSREALKVLHTAIRKITDDLERFSFNTCVSSFMIAVNDLRQAGCRERAVLRELVVLIAPFAPHIAEELWARLGETGSVNDAPYPLCNEEYLVEDSFEYPICINGKKRTEARFPADTAAADLEAQVLAMETVQRWLEGKPVKKFVLVPGRMINLVV